MAFINAVGGWFSSFPWLPILIVVIALSLCIVATWKMIPWDNIVERLRNPDSPARKIWVWVVASLLCFAVTNLLYFLSTSLAPHITPNAAMVFSVFWAIAIAILILLLIFILPDVLPGYGTLAGIGGGVLGWLLGMYISPQGTSEQVQFAKIGTAIVALFSGYTLKVVIDWLSKEESKAYRIYVLIAILSAAVSTAAVYNTRAYGNQEVKISFPDNVANPKDKQKVVVSAPADVLFNASVTGMPDTSVTWQILAKDGSVVAPNTDASIVNGRFKTGAVDTYTILARSNYDPRLADAVEITVNKN